MTGNIFEDVEKVIAFECARTGPQPDFPPLPEIAGGHYTSEDFYRLEREHVLARSWVCAERDEDLRKAATIACGTSSACRSSSCAGRTTSCGHSTMNSP